MTIGQRQALFAAIGCAALLAGCSRPPQPAPVQAPPQNAAAVAPSTVEVIYASGDVQGRRQGAWSAIDTGATLSRGDAVRTAAGAECQLRFADMAVVSIRESTELELDTVQLSGAGSQVTLGLVSGTILSKVRKLSSADGYNVRTSSALAGVRGTAFAVSLSAAGATTVAVQDGVVAVLPASFDTQALQAQVSAPVPELDALVGRVNASAAAVPAGREITVTAAANAAAATRFAAVRDAAAQIAREQAAGQAPSNATVTSRAAAVDAAVRGLAAATGTAARLNPAGQRVLQPLGSMPEPSQTPAPQTPAPASRTSGAPPAAAPAAPARAASATGTPSAPAAAPPAAPSPIHFTVTAAPADAQILRDGAPVGAGSYTADVADGTTLNLVVQHEGYAPKNVAVQIAAGKPASFNVQLEAQPIETKFNVSASPLVGALAVAGNTLVAADGTGHVIAADRQGRVLWSTATLNTPNENSFPVTGPGVVAFSGAREFLVLDAGTGQPAARTPLDGASTHLFGQHVSIADTVGVFPTSSSLRLFDPRTGRTLHDYPIPGGTLMSPSVVGGRIYAVSQAGLFVAVDQATGSVLTQIPTPANQPVATSVLVEGSRAYFADRKSLLVAVDLDAQRVAWRKTLPGQGGGGVFQDLAGSADGVYVFTRNTVYAYGTDGTPLFAPVPGASTPPLLLDGRLYFGTQSGKLSAVDALTGRPVASLDVGAVLNTRPVQDGPRIVVGTTKGDILVIYPGTMQ